MLFFLISGFVIEFSFSKGRDKSFSGYFIRRFVRIYGVLIPMLVISMATLRPDFQDINFWRILAGNLAMLQDFGTGKPNVIVPAIFASALWSLHYEWWFYMLYYPIKTNLRRQLQPYIVAIFSILSALIYIRFPYPLPRIIMYFVIWWIGVDMAYSYARRGKVLAHDIKVSYFGTFAVACILISQCLAKNVSVQLGVHPFLEPRHFIDAVAIAGVAFVWQKAKWAGFDWLKIGTLIAPISYALYISHQPLLIQASYLGWISNPWLRYFCYAIILLIFCWTTEIKFYPFLKSLAAKTLGSKPMSPDA